MTQKRNIITVFGATGNQGGSVVDIFLTDPKLKDQWQVRAVTRDATKESAKKLQSRGAEVVTADLNDKATLVKAMSGANAVFALTNYWEFLKKDVEVQQGKALVDAAKEAKVSQFIWSSLLHIGQLTNGKLPNVFHFDGKAEVETYARDSGVPSSFFMPGFFATNLPGQMLRPVPPENNWTLALPISETSPIPIFCPVDTGKWVKAMVLKPDQVKSQRVLAATSYMTIRQLLDVFKEVYPEAGKKLQFVQVSQDAFKQTWVDMGMPEYVGLEMLENMLLMQDFGYYGGESLEKSHGLLEDKLTTWEEFIKTSPVLEGVK